jgi:hypothetical protein
LLVDYFGLTWKLFTDFCHDEGVSCSFSGQWQGLRNACKFTKGATIKLGVTGSANNRVVCLCPSRMLVLQTKIHSSAGVGEGYPIYRAEEYFWKN